jgi:CheY-like chemotaxis protein
VQGAVNQNGGTISVASRLGVGTCFTIYLPIDNSQQIDIDAITPADAMLTQRGLSILLVDDEPLIRELCEKFLDLLGHTSIKASDGSEAVEIFKAKSPQIDVVLMDMMMPNMNGKEAYKLMKGINPAVKVIFSSGFTAENTASELIAEGVKHFIRKPYKLSELKYCLEEVTKK